MRKDDRGRWRAYQVTETWRSNLHPYAVVYVVIMDGRVAYVGQTVNLFQRMFAHGIRKTSAGVVTPWGLCRECVVKISISRRYGDWLMRELRLIRRLRPFGNKKYMAAA